MKIISIILLLISLQEVSYCLSSNKTVTKICLILNQRVKGVCDCDPSYPIPVPNRDHSKTEFCLDFRSIGDKCLIDEQCSHIENSICNDGKQINSITENQILKYLLWKDIPKGKRTSQVCCCKMGYYSSDYSRNQCIKYNNQDNSVKQKSTWSFSEYIKIVLLLFGVPLGFAITLIKLISYRNIHPERFGRPLPQTSVSSGQFSNSSVPTAPIDYSNLPFATFPLPNAVNYFANFETNIPIETTNYSDLPFATRHPLPIDNPSAPPDESRPPPYPNDLPTYEEALSVGKVRIL